MKSDFLLGNVLINIQKFNPITIYIDEKLVWDDHKSMEEGWISYEKALEKYGDIWNKTVRRVDIKIVEFHHSLVEIYTTRS